MNVCSSPLATDRLAGLGPGIIAATSFAPAGVHSKVALQAGADVLTLSVRPIGRLDKTQFSPAFGRSSFETYHVRVASSPPATSRLADPGP